MHRQPLRLLAAWFGLAVPRKFAAVPVCRVVSVPVAVGTEDLAVIPGSAVPPAVFAIAP